MKKIGDLVSLRHVKVVQPWFEARLNRIYNELREARTGAARERLQAELQKERRKAGLARN